MSGQSKLAGNRMLLYLLALVALGIVAGSVMTLNGHPSNPVQPSASETITGSSQAPTSK